MARRSSRPALGDCVLVEWQDIIGRSEWQHQVTAIEWAAAVDKRHKSVGYLLQSPKDAVVIAQTVACGDGQVMHVLRIPKGCIQRVVPLNLPT